MIPQSILDKYAHIPRARNTDPQTSHEAAKKAASKVERERADIFAAIRAAGMHGATAKEVARATGMDYHAVQKRMSDLHGRHKGVQIGVALIVPTGEEREGCTAWRAA